MIELIITIILLLLTLILVGSLFFGLFGIPYVPTPKDVFAFINNEQIIQDGMLVIEPGSGDAGFLRFFAKKYNIKGIGYEVSPYVYIVSLFLLLKDAVSKKVHVRYASYLQADFAQGDVIYLYLLPSALKQLLPKLQKVKKSCIIISYTFKVPGYTPYKTLSYKGKSIYLYSFQ